MSRLSGPWSGIYVARDKHGIPLYGNAKPYAEMSRRQRIWQRVKNYGRMCDVAVALALGLLWAMTG